MCVRFCPLTVEEAQSVLDARAGVRRGHVLSEECEFDPVYNAHPGSTNRYTYSRDGGALAVVKLEWGFPLDGKPHAVFNTRIESALEQLRHGRRGMWAKAIAHGRCLVPVRAFYESSVTERVISERTGKPVRRQYRFRLPSARAFLLAAIQEEGPLLYRDHRAQRERRSHPRPHASRPRTGRVERVAQSGFRITRRSQQTPAQFPS